MRCLPGRLLPERERLLPLLGPGLPDLQRLLVPAVRFWQFPRGLRGLLKLLSPPQRLPLLQLLRVSELPDGALPIFGFVPAVPGRKLLSMQQHKLISVPALQH